MNIQQVLRDAAAAQRSKEMAISDQLTLGELTLLLENVKNKSLPIRFDNEQFIPKGLISWRGSYCELAISYEDSVGTSCEDPPLPTCSRDEFGDHNYNCKCQRVEHVTTLPQPPSAIDLLNVLKLAKGKIFFGYKGGDFLMGKSTPIWVANYGHSYGYIDGCQTVTGIQEFEDKIIILTKIRKDR